MKLHRTFSRPDRVFPGEWIAPDPASTLASTVVLYLRTMDHDLCSLLADRTFFNRLAHDANCLVFSLDTPLISEHIFFTSVRECVHAYLTFLSRGISPARIIVAGDTRSALLVLATLIDISKLGQATPSGIALLSPRFDMEKLWYVRCPVDNKQGRGETANRKFYSAGHPNDMLSSVVKLQESSRLPSFYIQIGAAELHLSRIAAFVDGLISGGARVDLRILEAEMQALSYLASTSMEAGAILGKIIPFIKSMREFKEADKQRQRQSCECGRYQGFLRLTDFGS